MKLKQKMLSLLLALTCLFVFNSVGFAKSPPINKNIDLNYFNNLPSKAAQQAKELRERRPELFQNNNYIVKKRVLVDRTKDLETFKKNLRFASAYIFRRLYYYDSVRLSYRGYSLRKSYP